MSEDRIEAYRVDVYNFVFQMLDGEPDWTGDDAGKVAAATAKAFEVAIRANLGEEIALGGTCARCGARNRIVNECRCDPDNIPTKVSQ